MVRWSVPLLLAFLLLPHAAGQGFDGSGGSGGSGTDAFVELASDPTADHGAPAGAAQFDLVALSGSLDPAGDLIVSLTLAGFPSTASVALVDNAYYDVRFAHGDTEYDLDLTYVHPADAATELGRFRGQLTTWDGTAWRETDAPVAIVADKAAGVVTIRVPAAALVDHDDLPLRPGSALTDFWAASSSEGDYVATSAGIDGDRPTLHDRMPDDGFGGDLAVPVAEDDALLAFHSDAPVRASNGGPRTILYNVTVRNEGDADANVPLHVEGAPEPWTVRVVPDALDLAPGAEADVVVVVQAQGSHGHGGDDVFRLTGDDGTRSAGIDLAVHYPETPQPAGHHDTLWFHTMPQYGGDRPLDATWDVVNLASDAAGNPFSIPWMNTLEGDERDTGRDLAPDYVGDARLWRFPLAPALGVGLVLTGEEGEVTVPLTPNHDVDLEGVVVRAVLRHQASGGLVTELATSPNSAPVRLPAGTATEVVVPLPSEARTVPFQAGARLWLDVELVATDESATSGFGYARPSIAPGGHARLPLGEYDDPLPPAVLAVLQDEGVVDENGTLQAEPAVAASAGRDSPGPALPLLAGAVVVAVAARRRST